MQAIGNLYVFMTWDILDDHDFDIKSLYTATYTETILIGETVTRALFLQMPIMYMDITPLTLCSNTNMKYEWKTYQAPILHNVWLYITYSDITMWIVFKASQEILYQFSCGNIFADIRVLRYIWNM